MKIVCVLAKYNYGNPRLGLGVEYVAFIAALRNLGHDVVHFDSNSPRRFADPCLLNLELLETVREEKPQLVLTVQRDYELWTETLEEIRNASALTVTWITDDSFKFEKVSRFIARHYDVVATTYDYRIADYKANGLKNAIDTQWAANSEWMNSPISASVCQHAVTFIGAKYGDRERLVETIRSAGVKVECFGNGWPNGPIPTEKIPEIMRNSVISLNFSSGYAGKGAAKMQIKARTFEIPGAGGFLLSEYTEGIEKYYQPDREAVFFKNTDELIGKIRYYSDHPEERDQIAEAGFIRTQRQHTYESRFAEILKAAEKVTSVRCGSQHADSLEELARMFRSLGPVLRAFRWSLVALASGIWGSDRGKKAARRLVFETSWRVYGAKTFSAKGLPGRLFPGI